MAATGRNEVELARGVALELHAGQLYGGKPYAVHLAAVVDVLECFGFSSPKLLSAAWLHDTIEDTGATVGLLTERGISPEVIEIVQAVTDESGANRQERKAKTYPKIAALRSAVVVKLADRIANVEAGGKVAMYAAEQGEFRAALHDPTHELDALWNYLETRLAVSTRVDSAERAPRVGK